MKHPKSDIPQGVTEVEISEYSQSFSQRGGLIYFRIMECILDGQVVGQRSYDSDGLLRRETPIKEGKRHGREYSWNERGHLESMEPFFDGNRHGLAKQFARNGKLLGTYRFIHGTGFDIWRWEREDGSIYVSELFSAKDGALDGFEWWLNEDQFSVWHERHWKQGKFHGIERMWNARKRLKRGYPKYWLQNKQVKKRAYLKAAERDPNMS